MQVRRALAGAAAVLSAIALSSAVSVTSSSAVRSHPAAAAARYAVDERVCPPATAPGSVTCFAIVRRPATAGTPGAKLVPATSPAPAWTRGPAGGLTPRALAGAYDYDPNSGGTYQTVAIVDWYDDPQVVADLNAFDRHYGFPIETPHSFRRVNELGNTSPLPRADANSGVEITLDVQAVRSVCHLCRILLVEAAQPQLLNLTRAENTAARLGATEISNSFGSYEVRGHQYSDAVRQAFSHPGIVITASTGDDGWYGWDAANAPNGGSVPGTAAFPSTSPAVVAVGGTQLNLDVNGHRSSEPAWNGNGLDNARGHARGPSGATGSGCSVLLDADPWQKAAPNYAHSGCLGKRFTADVSADAAPATGLDIYDTFGTKGWFTVGGTSLSAPLIAGMWALVGGSRGVARPSEVLYSNRALRPYTVYDVVSGGSSWCGGDTIAGCTAAVKRLSGGVTGNPNIYEAGRVDCSYPLFSEASSTAPRNLSCNAQHGLDGPTGVGTPKSRQLFISPAPVVTVVPPARPITGLAQQYHATASDPVPGAHVVGYMWFWGDHSPGVHTTTGTATHTYKTEGTFTITLVVTDSVGQKTTVTKSVTARK